MITTSAFRPAWWLRGPHLQTLYPSLFRRRAHPVLQRERLELADGDFIDLDWCGDSNGPVVLVLHGLEGSLQSHYTGGILQALAASGYRAVLMYFRGCSGEPNRLARSYHSGETGDLATVVQHITRQHPDTPLAVIGYSLGGNVLLKWLGETGGRDGLATAVAVSVPFDLDLAAIHLENGGIVRISIDSKPGAADAGHGGACLHLVFGAAKQLTYAAPEAADAQFCAKRVVLLAAK